MTPSVSPNDVANRGLVDSEHSRKRHLRHAWVERANGLNVTLCELRPVVRNASTVSSLRHHVAAVVERRAMEQVMWITAGWIVATVKHIFTIWNRAVSNLKRHAMRAQLLAVATRNDAVSSMVSGASPKPAIGDWSWVQLVQKAVTQRPSAGAVTARFRAIGTPWSAWWPTVALTARLVRGHALSIPRTERVK